MSDEIYSDLGIKLGEEWGIPFELMPTSLRNQVAFQERVTEMNAKAGDYFVLMDLLSESEKNELLDSHSTIPADRRKQFAKFVFETKIDKVYLQAAKNKLLAALLKLPHIGTISGFTECKLSVVPQARQKEKLSKECQDKNCLPFSNESTDKLYLAFSSEEEYKEFRAQGPQIKSPLKTLASEFGENVYYILTEKDTVLIELGDSNPYDEQGGGILITHAELKNSEKEGAKRWADIFDAAIRNSASDIHFEPSLQSSKLTTPTDKSIRKFSHAISQEMIGYLSAKTRATQVGAHIFKGVSGEKFEYENDTGVGRINMRPEFVANGVKDARGQDLVEFVVRVWKQREELQTLEELNIPKVVQPYINSCIRSSRGLSLVVGPTGSGKSTLILAMIDKKLKLSNYTEAAVSLEDPIEQILPGLKQIQLTDKVRRLIQDGNSLTDMEARENILKSFLRLDYDFGFIGEMRDAMTISFAADMANSGHPTFATFHADSPVKCFTRLSGKLESSVDQQTNLFTALSMVITTALVRKACDECKKPYRVPDDDWLAFSDEFGFTKEQMSEIKSVKWFINTGVVEEKRGEETELVTCKKCDGKGSVGRIPVIGAFKVTDERRRKFLDVNDAARFIKGCEKPDIDMNQELVALIKTGMVSYDGLAKYFTMDQGE